MVCFNDISSVKGAIVNFYNKVYREDHPGKPLLKGLSYDSISDDNGWDLEEFSEEEISKAVNDLGKEKAPGLDGFSIAFSQHCRSIVNGEVVGLFSKFHSEGVFEKSLNATFISLIPKVARPAYDISKFKHIGSEGSVDKILAKVLHQDWE